MSRLKDAYRYTESRLRLGELLTRFEDRLRGRVLDLGGHRGHDRGTFKPGNTESWVYLNIDAAMKPDVVGFGERLPFVDAAFDSVLCNQVLEHVRDEWMVVDEVRRILRPGGVFILSVPFLYPIHAHPEDHRRFTEQGLRGLLNDFEIREFLPMGGTLSVAGDFVKITGKRLPWGLRRVSAAFAAHVIAPLARREMDRYIAKGEILPVFTPGYFVVAARK